MNNKHKHKQMEKSILIMAGGTGGHIFPALAVADVLHKKGLNIEWLGTRKGLESRLVPEHHYVINYIDIGGLRGKGIKTVLLLPFMLLRALLQTLSVYKRVQPDVVLGMGGFVTGPGGVVAWMLGKPLVLHEQNAIAGLTNKILFRLSKKVFAAFPDAFKQHKQQQKVRVIGNPVRKEIVQLMEPEQRYKQKWFGFELRESARQLSARQESARQEKDKKGAVELNILVVGGSLGAFALNERVPQALELIMQNGLMHAKGSLRADGSHAKGFDFKQINVRHQCGEKNLKTTEENYKNLINQSVYDVTNGIAGNRINIEVMSFISDMAGSYLWADLVICRSGALTVSEIAAVGVASLLVPFPHAVDDHQTANAEYLANKGAAFLIQQDKLDKQTLAALIMKLNKRIIVDMAIKARSLAINDAADVVANECLKLSGALSASGTASGTVSNE